MTTNYISINAILYDLSLTIDDRYWNQNKMTEWAYKALRLIRSDVMLESKLVYLEVNNHKASLPNDLKYLTQIAYTPNACHTCISEHGDLDLPSTSQLLYNYVEENKFPWRALTWTNNGFHLGVCDKYMVTPCNNCIDSFTVTPDLTVTTTFCDGIIAVSYLGYPLDEQGCALIPNDEELKEAILHYVLYRYWMVKYNMKEEGSESRMQHYLQMWNTMSKKAAGNLNLPDVNQLENLKNQWNRLVPRTNQFQSMFLRLGNRENINF